MTAIYEQIARHFEPSICARITKRLFRWVAKGVLCSLLIILRQATNNTYDARRNNS